MLAKYTFHVYRAHVYRQPEVVVVRAYVCVVRMLLYITSLSTYTRAQHNFNFSSSSNNNNKSFVIKLRLENCIGFFLFNDINYKLN